MKLNLLRCAQREPMLSVTTKSGTELLSSLTSVTEDGRMKALLKFCTANIIFGSFLGVICFRTENQSFS